MTSSGPGSVDRTERQLTAILASWGAAWVVIGGVLWLRGDADRRESFGRQSAAWGAVDLVIAGVGTLRSRRRGGEGRDDDRRRLHRILLINSALDVGYVATGAALMARAEWIGPRLSRRRSYAPEQLRGDGQAIVVQGLFLLALDSVFAARTRG